MTSYCLPLIKNDMCNYDKTVFKFQRFDQITQTNYSNKNLSLNCRLIKIKIKVLEKNAWFQTVENKSTSTNYRDQKNLLTIKNTHSDHVDRQTSILTCSNNKYIFFDHVDRPKLKLSPREQNFVPRGTGKSPGQTVVSKIVLNSYSDRGKQKFFLTNSDRGS